jgi:EAL domain-containing protein (putative c-di-GMP-specific phosphodiesterase class I)
LTTLAPAFASLTTLRDLAVDKVKIDRSFVKDLLTNSHCRAIIVGIVHLALNLGLEVVAEGIETTEQRDALLELGCRVGQGYLWGRPAAGADTFLLGSSPQVHRSDGGLSESGSIHTGSCQADVVSF